MGAQTFEQYVEGTDVHAAFRDGVEQAAWENGHGGYTGTLAEKHEFVLYTPPSHIASLQAVTDMQWSDKREPDYADFAWRHAASCYNDKWGPAVAIGDDEGQGFWFIGWASS